MNSVRGVRDLFVEVGAGQGVGYCLSFSARGAGPVGCAVVFGLSSGARGVCLGHGLRGNCIY